MYRDTYICMYIEYIYLPILASTFFRISYCDFTQFATRTTDTRGDARTGTALRSVKGAAAQCRRCWSRTAWKVRFVFADAAATSTATAELACLLVFFFYLYLFALALSHKFRQVFGFFLFLLFFYTSTPPRLSYCPTHRYCHHTTRCGVWPSVLNFLCSTCFSCLSLSLSLFFHSCILHVHLYVCIFTHCQFFCHSYAYYLHLYLYF